MGLLLGQHLFIRLFQLRLAVLIAADLDGLPVEDLDELIPIDALVFQQGLHHPVHGLPVLLQHGLGPVELLLQDAAHFRIHLGGHFLGIIPLVAPILGDEHLRVPAQEHRANGVAHAELDHHAPGQLAGPLQVANGAGAYVVQGDALGHPAAHAHADLVQDLAPGDMVVVRIRHGHGIAGRSAPGDDGNLVYRIAMGHFQRHDGMARLMVSGDLFILVRDHPALLFRAHHRPGDGLLQLQHGDLLFLIAGRQDGRLVQYVLQIRPGKAAGPLGQHRQGHVLRQGLALGVDL